jgi:hypothetical protein
MERTTSIIRAKEIMGQNFIGLQELISLQEDMGIFIPEDLGTKLPVINFNEVLLSKSKNDYLLILGIPFFKDQTFLNLKKMRDHFGINPEVAEPCFYNQDWYINEEFYLRQLDYKWHLVRNSVIEETRSQNPDEGTFKTSFPSAVLGTYVFFAFWYRFHKILWSTDYIWCSDTDHNGDRIYIGRYIDPLGINKNGFSIHRHLKIRANYGSINVQS